MHFEVLSKVLSFILKYAIGFLIGVEMTRNSDYLENKI